MNKAKDSYAALRFAKFIGTLDPIPRSVAEAHSGIICHRDKITDAHVWIQRYNDDGSVHVLHGRDSVLPGLEIPALDAGCLLDCDCGEWMPATKEAAHRSRLIAHQTILAHSN